MGKAKETTIYDIARRLNISPATVSRGLKDHPGISKKTKKKISDMVEEMGFRAFGMETPWVKAETAARYVQDCQGSPVEAIRGRRYPLTGLLECGKCGTPMIGSGGAYRCQPRRGGCNAVRIDAPSMICPSVSSKSLLSRQRGSSSSCCCVRPAFSAIGMCWFIS